MSDSRFSSTPASGLPPSGAHAAAARAAEMDDFALGCECADPALQIERWDQETAASAAAHGEPY